MALSVVPPAAAVLEGGGAAGGGAAGSEEFSFGDEALASASKAATAAAAVADAAAQKVKEAAQGFTVASVGTSLTSWWSAWDPLEEGKRADEAAGGDAGGGAGDAETSAPAPPAGRSAPAAAAAAAREGTDEEAKVRALFAEVGEDERLIETVPCKLQQTYRCFHNALTPDVQMAFAGTLYVTDKHACFNVEERGRKLPVCVAHADIASVERQRPTRRSEKADTLRIVLKAPEQFLSLKDFKAGGLDSALAILEHLVEEQTH